jgi:peptidoglycan-N-acetylglucosamine deacetylase
MPPAQSILLTLAGLGALYVGIQIVLPHLWKKGQIRKLRDEVRGKLILTYDDGPWDGLTPELLGLLQKRGARASFFMLGEKVEAAPELARSVAEAGHEVGSHSYSHHHPWKSAPWTRLQDLARGHSTLSAAGLEPAGHRPPYGKLCADSAFWLGRAGQGIRWWTHDSGDSGGPLDVAACLRSVREAGGAVVLMHDGYAPGERHAYVLEVTAALLDLADEQGWQVGGFELLGG